MPSINSFKYCNSFFEYSRFKTREVKVGSLGIGGINPIRVQSMTTTNTMDTIKTIEQSIRMIDVGCELVRITAPSITEAKNLEVIRKELHKRGYTTPLCADIHFTPNAAELAARIVEKVRINPGNYADKKKFEYIEYTDKTYNEELERIRERFLPLIKVCKEYGTAMRIGTNHGSLSDRILSRYGDTPAGMVESALEFLRICEEEKYYDIVLSMKASNPQVMVQAYRLLVNKFIESDRNYPLHLGVTEAGDGEDGRIKSAVGIGTLLEDGLGDTIRVSLTEDPEFEIPVAKNIVERYSARTSHEHNPFSQISDLLSHNPSHNPFVYSKRETLTVSNFGGKNVPRVVMDLSDKQKISPANLFAAGYNYSISNDKWNISDQACDFIYVGDNEIDFEIPGTLGLIYNPASFLKLKKRIRCYPIFSSEEYFSAKDKSAELNFIKIGIQILLQDTFFERIKNDKTVVLVFETHCEHGMEEQRSMFFLLDGINIPVIIKRDYSKLCAEKLQLYAATDIGALYIEGFGDGIWIHQKECAPQQTVNSLSFGILQATRVRISKTEYISCPSCGRTQFDLQEVTAKIRARTSHLKGVKIGIMGCIVNGPGEMADADYGYVGTGEGKITLYKQKAVVKRNIPEDTAVEELINLIKENGDWVDMK